MSKEVVEEETYLYLDFNGLLDEQLLQKTLYFNLIDLDKEHPVLQLGDQIFKGTIENSVGTYLFFNEDNNDQNEDTNDIFDKNPVVNLKFSAKTTKVLKLNKAHLEDTSSSDNIELKEREFDYLPFKDLLEKLKLGTLKLDEVPVKSTPEIFMKPAIPKKKIKPSKQQAMLLKDIGKSVALQQVKNKFQ